MEPPPFHLTASCPVECLCHTQTGCSSVLWRTLPTRHLLQSPGSHGRRGASPEDPQPAGSSEVRSATSEAAPYENICMLAPCQGANTSHSSP